MRCSRFWAGVLPVWCLAAALVAQNSTRKLRPEPSATAARVGEAVAWREDLDSARAESARTGRPVFWYVPTLPGSPMDRKQELDRYMLAGPFSDPGVVALLNEGFVPVRAVPGRDAMKSWDLRPGAFIEPGFLVVDGDGAELLRCQRLATLRPRWFVARLTPVAAAAVPAPRALPPALDQAWQAYRAGDLDTARDRLVELAAAPPAAPDLRAEAAFLTGAVQHRSGRADQAGETWAAAAEEFADQSYGWKCAAEAEGHGPFARGFEDFLELPEPALGSGDQATSRAAAGAYDAAELRRRSLSFLLRMQQPDGSYTDSRYDFGGTDGLPNVHAAVTAIVALALLEELAAADFRGDRQPTERALSKALHFLGSAQAVNADDRDEIVWAHVYRVLLLARWLELRPAEAELVRPVLERVTRALLALQPDDGAWFHEYPNPFTTASVLCALDQARRAGVAIDDAQVERGVAALLRCRVDNGAFTYGQVRRGPARARLAGAAGRMPLCELALSSWRPDGAQPRLAAALAAAFEHHDQLESVRKYDDHANALGYGGFFFWYDMHGRCAAIAALEDDELRRDLAARQRELILGIAEIDGCFVDSHELGRVYGTASALWCLRLLAARTE